MSNTLGTTQNHGRRGESQGGSPETLDIIEVDGGDTGSLSSESIESITTTDGSSRDRATPSARAIARLSEELGLVIFLGIGLVDLVYLVKSRTIQGQSVDVLGEGSSYRPRYSSLKVTPRHGGLFGYGINRMEGVESFWDDNNLDLGWMKTRFLMNKYDIKSLNLGWRAYYYVVRASHSRFKYDAPADPPFTALVVAIMGEVLVVASDAGEGGSIAKT
ncbi:hypothetical protein Pfo_003560 [Paulownia fortunei]|nr:hypothetical protein Pfo_003560 [Paulownia fortunei]